MPSFQGNSIVIKFNKALLLPKGAANATAHSQIAQVKLRRNVAVRRSVHYQPSATMFYGKFPLS